MEYEVVITTFNNTILDRYMSDGRYNHYLDYLIDDIHSATIRYLPKRIILVDDCSTDDITPYKASYWNTSRIPITHISTKEHKGPFYAEQLGLSNVSTPYAIVCHADARLQGYFQNPYTHPNGRVPFVIKVYDDPLSVLVSYLDQTGDAIAVGCSSLTLPCNPIGNLVANGMRSLGIDRLPYTYRRKFKFDTLLLNKYYTWQECYSIDDICFALRMEFYNKIGYNEKFAPYLYYHDDFYARAREQGYRTYFTQETVTYHRNTKQKPLNSLAIVHDEMYEDQAEAFHERYDDTILWKEQSFARTLEVVHTYRGRDLAPRR